MHVRHAVLPPVMKSLTADVEVSLDALETQAINGSGIGVKRFVHMPHYHVKYIAQGACVIILTRP